MFLLLNPINFFQWQKKEFNKGRDSNRGNININLGSSKSLLNNTVRAYYNSFTFIVSINIYCELKLQKYCLYWYDQNNLPSAILSYGLVLVLERDLMSILVKGTIVLFASLIIYVILILIGVLN